MCNKLLKFFGWVLLLAGLFIIGWTLISSYNIFSGKTESPEVFKIEVEEIPAAAQEKIPTTQAELQKEMERMIGEQLKGLLSVDTLPKLLNLAIWTMLACVKSQAGGAGRGGP